MQRAGLFENFSERAPEPGWLMGSVPRGFATNAHVPVLDLRT